MPRQIISQRNDGRFKCKYKDKQFYGKTQEEAFKKRDEWILKEKQGFNHEKDGSLFINYGKQFVDVCGFLCQGCSPAGLV